MGCLLVDSKLICHVRDKSSSGHGVTFGETIAVSSVEMHGATAFEVSGTFRSGRNLLRTML